MTTQTTSHQSIAPAATRYWVIGGQFCSTEFSKLVPGTGCLTGPFHPRESAMQAWREMSQERRSECTVRYTIVAEPWS